MNTGNNKIMILANILINFNIDDDCFIDEKHKDIYKNLSSEEKFEFIKNHTFVLKNKNTGNFKSIEINGVDVILNSFNKLNN